MSTTADNGALSPRELEVLRLLCAGRNRTQIARDLGISQNTARTHIGNLMGKLGVATQIQAVAWAFRSGVATPEPRARSRPVACPSCGRELVLLEHGALP